MFIVFFLILSHWHLSEAQIFFYFEYFKIAASSLPRRLGLDKRWAERESGRAVPAPPPRGSWPDRTASRPP